MTATVRDAPANAVLRVCLVSDALKVIPVPIQSGIIGRTRPRSRKFKCPTCNEIVVFVRTRCVLDDSWPTLKCHFLREVAIKCGQSSVLDRHSPNCLDRVPHGISARTSRLKQNLRLDNLKSIRPQFETFQRIRNALLASAGQCGFRKYPSGHLVSARRTQHKGLLVSLDQASGLTRV